MARGQETVLMQDVAAGHVTGATGVATKIRGATVSRAGVGQYDITINPVNADLLPDPSGQGNLSGGLPRAEAHCKAQALEQGAGPCTVQIAHTSDTVKQVVITDDADVGVDADFSFNFRRILG